MDTVLQNEALILTAEFTDVLSYKYCASKRDLLSLTTGLTQVWRSYLLPPLTASDLPEYRSLRPHTSSKITGFCPSHVVILLRWARIAHSVYDVPLESLECCLREDFHR